MFLLLQSLLGLYPYAPPSRLLIDPFLPPWLPEITRVRQASPWSLTATFAERLKDLLTSLLPSDGHRGLARVDGE